MENKKILVGSNVFFKNLPGFKPHDTDYIIINYSNNTNNFTHYIQNKICYFVYEIQSKDKLIEYIINTKNNLNVCSLISPELIRELQLTIDDLRQDGIKLKFFRLNKKWKYAKYIYNCYLENNELELTNEQLLKAYNLYLQAR
jgi:hypothetical protein